MSLSPDLLNALQDAHNAFSQLTPKEQRTVMETTPDTLALLMGNDHFTAEEITKRIDEIYPKSVPARQKLEEIPKL
jgi:hypothetical protein